MILQENCWMMVQDIQRKNENEIKNDINIKYF